MKISGKKLAQIIREEIIGAMYEQRDPEEDPTGVFAGDRESQPFADGAYTDQERLDLDPIKTSHKNLGLKGPTRLRAAAEELKVASDKFSDELMRNASKYTDIDPPRRAELSRLYDAYVKLQMDVVRRINMALELAGDDDPKDGI